MLEEQTVRGLQAVDLTLTGIIDALTLSPGLGDHNPAFEDTLRGRLKALPEIRALFVIGPDGFITQDTDHPNTPHIALADRDYFKAHVADPSPALRIGKPLISRSVQRWFVSVSRRITRPDGSFGGIAVAAVEPPYFERFFRELDLGDHDRIALYRRDGILLVGSPYDEKAIGKDNSTRTLFQKHLPETANGTYRALSPLDQTPRLVSYRSISGFPLVVAVALAEDDLLAGWRRNATVTVAAAGLVAILLILLVSLSVRRRTERDRAQQLQAQAREDSLRTALKMATVLESTTDAVLDVDRTWRVTFMNERARTLLPGGRDATGQGFWEAYPELVSTNVATRFQEVMEVNAPCELEVTGPLSGRVFFARAFPSREGMAVFFQDITERRQAEQERKGLARELEKERMLLKGVLAHLPSGVFAAAAPDGRRLLHNAALERLLGHPVHDAQGVNDYAKFGAVHPDGSPYAPEEYPLLRALLHDEEVAQEEMLYRRGDGSLTTFAISAAPVRDTDGRTVMAVLTLQDIAERKRMEEALRRGEERLKENLTLLDTIIESSPDPIFVKDMEGRYIVANAATGFVHGKERNQLIGVPEQDRASFENGAEVRDNDRQIMRSGQAVTCEEVVFSKGHGETRCYLSTKTPLRDDTGRVVGIIGISRDITDLKRIETAQRSSETRYRGLVETQADLIVRIGPDGRFTFVNDTACRTLGPLRDELLKSPWTQFVHPDDHEAIRAAIEETKTALDHRSTVEARILTVDGIRWFAWEGCAIFDEAGHFVEKQSVGRDITERKAMEDALRRAKEEAERASLAKSKFLAAASHDLRQPLQSIFLFAAALHGQVSTERGRSALDTLERNLEALKGLLDSLFDVSRLDAEVIRPTVEDVLLAPVLDQIGASFAPIARGKGLDFKVDVPANVVVRSDRHLLGRMVRNLIENAIKYTEQGSIHLECRVVGVRAHLAVHDTGIGIAPDQQDLVFVEFHQVANPERDRNKGLGLGLSIVQRLSKLLDHPVSMRSVPGRGSVFTVDVPLGETRAVRPSEPFAAVAPNGGGRLAVLIDDEADVLLGLREIVRDWGYDTITGTSAEQARERLRMDGRTPAVIVSDYRLAENRTGVDAVLLVREQVGAMVPGVILTGDTGPELRAEAAKQGLGIVIKPVTPRLLHETLKKLLGEAA
ncbi:PAS domain-containing protein [Azospirillum sp. sgz301742]